MPGNLILIGTYTLTTERAPRFLWFVFWWCQRLNPELLTCETSNLPVHYIPAIKDLEFVDGKVVSPSLDWWNLYWLSRIFDTQ